MKSELSGLFSTVTDVGQRVRDRASLVVGFARPKPDEAKVTAAPEQPVKQRRVTAAELAAENDRGAVQLAERRRLGLVPSTFDASRSNVPEVSAEELARGLNGRIVGVRDRKPL